jgi:hypothetical protein
MKQLTTWTLALLTLAGAAGLSGAWTGQETDQPKQRPNPERVQGKRIQNPKGRAEKHNNLKKVLPTLKTSLVEGIGLAEKESGGKAFSATVQVDKDGKASIAVDLFVNDKFTNASVDPETKKVTVKQPKGNADGGSPAGEDSGAGADDSGDEGGG